MLRMLIVWSCLKKNRRSSTRKRSWRKLRKLVGKRLIIMLTVTILSLKLLNSDN